MESNNKIQKYDAFISYRHTDLDVLIAETVHKELERYHIPKKMRDEYGKSRFSRIFRDKEELSVSLDLSKDICEALQNSEYLIVLCSPEARESKWIQREISYFLEYHDRDHILPVLIKGEPQESFPRILCERSIQEREESSEEVIHKVVLEPLAADVRGNSKKEILKKCKTELLRLIAAMLSCSYDMLKQRHREYIMKKVVTIMGVALILSIGFSVFAIDQRNQINLQYEASQRNQARYLSEKAGQLIDKGDRIGALSTVMSVFPEDEGSTNAVVPEQMYILNRALYTYQHTDLRIYDPMIMKNLEGVTTDNNSFNWDGSIFFCLDDFGNVYFYDTETYELIWKASAQLFDKDSKQTFLWGCFWDRNKVMFASANAFYVLSMEDQSCERKINADSLNHKGQPSTVHENILAVSYEMDDHVYFYDLKQGRLIKRLSCDGEKDGIINSLAFSDDGKYFVAGMRFVNLFSLDDDKEIKENSLFVFDCMDWGLINSFCENDIARVKFLNDHKLAIISYHTPKNDPFNIMYFEYEYENKILDYETGKILWKSEKYRYSTQFEETDMGIEDVGLFNVNEDTLPVVIFYNKGLLEAVDVDGWSTFHQKDFESDILFIKKMDDDNLLIALSDGMVFRSSLAVYIAALTEKTNIQNAYYDPNVDAIVQIVSASHGVIFSKKSFDENLTYYGTELPKDIAQTVITNEDDGNKVVNGKKYTAKIEDGGIMITIADTQDYIMRIPIDHENVLFDFITEDYLLLCDFNIGRLTVWDISNTEILTDQLLDMNLSYKSEMILDKKRRRFALNLGEDKMSLDQNSASYGTLDIFSWDEDFRIYHYASIPHGEVDFENDKIYLRTYEDGKKTYYFAPIYDYKTLKKWQKM